MTHLLNGRIEIQNGRLLEVDWLIVDLFKAELIN